MKGNLVVLEALKSVDFIGWRAQIVQSGVKAGPRLKKQREAWHNPVLVLRLAFKELLSITARAPIHTHTRTHEIVCDPQYRKRKKKTGKSTRKMQLHLNCSGKSNRMLISPYTFASRGVYFYFYFFFLFFYFSILFLFFFKSIVMYIKYYRSHVALNGLSHLNRLCRMLYASLSPPTRDGCIPDEHSHEW